MLYSSTVDETTYSSTGAGETASGGGSETALSTGETSGTDLVPGNTTTSLTLAVGDTATGFINTPSDADWFYVNLTAGQSYNFAMTATSGGLDCYIEIRTSDGSLLAVDDDGGGGTNSLATFVCIETGSYLVSAKAFSGDGQTSSGGYTLSATTTAQPNILDSIDWGTKLASNTVLVYFAAAGETVNGTTSLGWNAYEKQQAMLALQQYANVANLTFQVTTNSAAATFRLTTTTSSDFLGEFAPPGTSGAGYGGFARNGSGWDEAGGGGLEFGGLGFAVLIHEFGHGLGMAHPHDNGGTSEIMQRVTSEFNSFGLYGLNEGVFTVMSYNDGWALGPSGLSPSTNYGYEATPMALDIALIQEKYGANTNYHTGNDTYSLTSPSTTSSYACIWDAGGNDTIAYSGSAACVINLTPATIDYTPTGGGVMSYVTGTYGGFTIAQGVVIESATGGSGDDKLTGNSANNILTGNAGNDTIDGGAGHDTAYVNAAFGNSSVIHSDDGSWSVLGGADGVDTVTNVEIIHFTNRNVSLWDQGPDTADFNFDVKSDILYRNTNGELYVWNSQAGSVSFVGQTLGMVSTDWHLQGYGDYNGDGKADVLWRNVSGELYLSASGNGAGVALTGQSLGFVDNAWSVVSAKGDFNGDGRTDILFRNTSGEVYVWNSQLTTGVGYVGQTLGFTPNDWQIKGVGDFNGDGKSDILWRNVSGEVYTQSSSGGSAVALTGQTQGFVPSAWTIQGVADFNGDGRDDILWRHTNGDVYVWGANSGTNVSFTGQSISNVPLDWSIAAIGDYNGDGRADILWRNDNGDVYVWNSNPGSSVSFTGQDLGIVANAWHIVTEDHWI